MADLTTQSIFRGALPGLLGGPWQWATIGAAGARADPDAFLVVASFLVVTAVVASSIVLWRGATRAWLVLLAYTLLNLALVARSRATFIGPVIGTEYRYQTDVALVAAIALGLATMRTVGRFPYADADPLTPRAPARAWLSENVLEPMREAGAAPATSAGVVRLGAGLGAGLLLASSLFTTVRYDPSWVANPAHAYVDTVRAELARMPAGTRLADVQVPDEVAWPLLSPYNRTYRLFAPVLTGAQVLAAGHSTASLVAPDRDGHLRRALIAGPTAKDGPVTGCGWELGDEPVRIPLGAEATDELVVVRIGYLATAATTLDVTAGGTTVEVEVSPGQGSAFVAAPGPVNAVVVERTGDNTRVCTDDITAGAPVAAPVGPS